MDFFDQVLQQLRGMSEEEKEEWILLQAKLTRAESEQDFLLSLSGEKKVMYMPEEKEIESFCEQVENGCIYLEYVAHYYQFDDDARYIDQWQVWYQDPAGALPFLNRILRGCHDLLKINQNELAAEILERVCRLEFLVEESEESENFEYEGVFTIEDAIREGKIPLDIKEVGRDWVSAVIRSRQQWDGRELAGRLVPILSEPVCRELEPSMISEQGLPEDLFFHMKAILEEEIKKEESTLRERFADQGMSTERSLLENRIKRKQAIMRDLRVNHLDEEVVIW